MAGNAFRQMQPVGADGDGEPPVGGDEETKPPRPAETAKATCGGRPIRRIVIAEDDGGTRRQGANGGSRIRDADAVGHGCCGSDNRTE